MVHRQKWHSLTEASEQLGFDRNYVSLWLRRHKDKLPEEMLIESESGTTKLISEEGIKWIEENTKKEGALVSNRPADEDKYLILVVLGKALNIHFTGGDRGSLEKNILMV